MQFAWPSRVFTDEIEHVLDVLPDGILARQIFDLGLTADWRGLFPRASVETRWVSSASWHVSRSPFRNVKKYRNVTNHNRALFHNTLRNINGQRYVTAIINRIVTLFRGIEMGREAKITYEQVAAAADAMCAANVRPSSRSVRERLGNTGSMGTINRLLQEWKATQERHITQSLTLPPVLQRTILDFMAQELANAKAQLELAMSEQRQEMTDLALENERQGADIEERINADIALRAELATLQGRIAQTESELIQARRETGREREDAGIARIDLAKALLRLETMPRLETDLEVLRADLKAERQARSEASQHAAVLEAKLEAARDRAVQAEAFTSDLKAAVVNRATTRGDHSRIDDAERRRKPTA